MFALRASLTSSGQISGLLSIRESVSSTFSRNSRPSPERCLSYQSRAWAMSLKAASVILKAQAGAARPSTA